jgi:hypothetical protein
MEATKLKASPMAAALPVLEERTARPALTTRETASRKPRPRMPANEIRYVRRYHQTPVSLGSSTFQMVFMASLSWTTTPRAATSSSATPVMAARRPDCGELAPTSMASTALLPVSPNSDRNWAVRLPRTASAPKNRPATLVTINSSGPIENTE